MLLEKVPKWDDVSQCFEYLRTKGVELDESGLFDETSHLAAFLEGNSDDAFKLLQTVSKWTTYFETVPQSTSVQLLKIAYYFFAIPSQNANVERLFSFMNNYWSDERNRLLPQSVQSLVMIKVNFKLDCTQFYDMICNNTTLLESVRSGEKYKKQ